MVTRDFSGEDVYTVLVNVGNFEHVRTSGSHVIVEWTPPSAATYSVVSSCRASQ